ncbi:MAG: protein kinase [Planctomyces sp.]|nr:protein kinase [Planctomyces sp.]
MNDNRSIDDVFCTAIEIASATERQAWLEQVCGNDTEFRRRVDRLLQAHDRGGSIVDAPAHAVATTFMQPAADCIGTQIGPYKLLQKIGEGGMGIVYMAEQTTPIARKVALKLIKPGMDSREVIARFEAERQALALMDHVNIARVLDAGTTNSDQQDVGPGRPYFVMELIHGVPITRYCDDNQLTLRQRLELFLSVCHAIQHAHQKGIIHRDIKPSNVMVTLYDGRPVPKVIDFGVAKTTEQKLTERTLFTQYGTMVGTLEYMSPEQAEMSALGVDTRSDIYSLGVLLYELLTGSTPLNRRQFAEAGYAEMLRLIKEQEPPLPSTRLSESGAALASISAQRQVQPAKLSRLVRGELDWIVMKPLNKDRVRRYETVNAFADDIRRYLDDQPVIACPPSRLYRLKKFVHLHRLGVLTFASFAIMLILTTLISLRLRLQAEIARDYAHLAAYQAQQARDAAAENEQRAILSADTERQHLYVARMNLANKAMDSGRLMEARSILKDYSPGSADQNRRGFEWHYWNRQCNTVMLKSTLPIWSTKLSVSDNGRSLATSQITQGVSSLDLWDINATRMQHLSTASGALAFSHDGSHLASASMEFDPSVVTIWDTTTGARVRDIATSETIIVLAFSADDRRLIAAAQNGFTVFDAADGKIIQEHTLDSEAATCFAISDDAHTVIAGCGDGSVLVWNLNQSEDTTPSKFAAHRDHIRTVQLVPGTRRFVTTSDDRTICLWDADSHKSLWQVSLNSSPLSVSAISPDGQTLLVGDTEGLVHVISLENGVEDLRFFADTGFLSGIHFLKSGREFITGGLEIRTWNIEPPSSRTVISEASEALSVAPDGDTLACNNCLRSVVRNSRIPLKTHEAILVSDFSNDGQRLVTGTNQGSVDIWDPVSGERLQKLEGHTKHVGAVDFSPDGKLVASGSSDHSIRIWDLNHPERPIILTAHATPVTCVAFSPDGRLLASAQGDRLVKLWNPRTGTAVGVLPQHSTIVQHLRFSPDGRLLATSAGDLIQIWDVTSQQSIMELSGHEDLVWTFEFSPDGATLASGSQDKSLKLWDVRTGTEKATFLFADGVRNLKFTTNGSSLFVASDRMTTILRGAAPDADQNREAIPD